MKIDEFDNLNKKLYKPAFITKAKNFVYLLCYSHVRSILKISYNKNKFIIEDFFYTGKEIQLIKSGWDIELLLLCQNEIILKDKNFNTQSTFKIDKEFTIDFLNISPLRKNIIYIIGKTKKNIMKIYEIKFSNNSFEIINNYLIPYIAEVGGFIDISNNQFLISDTNNNKVISHDINTGCSFNLCTEGRFGKGKVRKPCEILYSENFVFICDKHNYLIQIFDDKLNFKSQFGGKGRDLKSFDLAVSMTKFSKNNFLIADMNNDRILLFNNYSKKIELILKRNFSNGSLARPTSMCLLDEKIYVSDRDNDIVQIFDENFNFVDKFSHYLLRRPTSVVKILINNNECISVLTRGDTKEEVYILIFYKNGTIIKKRKFNELNDPQGMISIPNNRLCVSDTLNRKGILLNHNLDILNRVDLSKLSGDNRFLCRVPSLINNQIFFSDYHTGKVIVTDLRLNFIKSFTIDFHKFGLLNLRRIFKVKNNYLLLGTCKKESSPLIFVHSSLSNINKFEFIKNPFETPVDYICLNKKHIFLDKEFSILRYLDLPL